MNYNARVYIGDMIKDVSLSVGKGMITIGSSEYDTLRVLGADIIPNHLSFVYNSGNWVCTNKEKGESKIVADGDIFVLSMQSKIAVVVFTDDIIPQRIKLKSCSNVTIGRDFECMFHLPDRSVGRKHAIIAVDDFSTVIIDQNSLNGTYVNNRKITEATLKDGDIISIGKFDILYANKELKLCVEPKDSIKSDYVTKKEQEYPVFNLSPRLRHQTPSDVIEIQAPPNIGDMPMVNWLSFLPMLATRSPYAAIFPLTSVFSTFLQKKKYKKAQEVRQDKYENYLAAVKAKIDKNRDDQFLSLEESNHETSKCYDIALKRERTLWERSAEDDDFMKVRIGKGDIQTSFKIKFPDNVLRMYNDELEDQGEELGRGNQILEGAPILCDIYHDLSVGIIGEREKAISVARNMIIQLATTHSYQDLKLVTLFSKDEASSWEFVKWLPHSFNESRDFRYVSNTVFSASTLDKTIDEELVERKKQCDNEFENIENKPFYLFVVANPEMIEKSEIENYLDFNHEGFGIGVIYVYNKIHDLPRSCNIIIDIQPDKNEVFHKSNIGIKQEFEIDKFDRKKADIFARSLAPVRIAERKTVADMPTCVTFLEGHGVKKVDELPVWENWNNTNPSKSITAPLGIKANGEPFMFNIMYGPDFMRYHGSHGLVAGATRSGKSEMVQSWILSLALRYSPEEISFVIIDYKGTGMLLPFENLPHLAGKISNIDGNVRRNIIAINQEIKRRQLLFDKLGIKPEIKEYFAKGFHKTVEPMPAIIVVVDEFAEVKKNLPEFIPILESLFAVGSALGIWVVLSTQKPSGVVTDKMYANANFRWCCRVASSGDSKEMLHHTDAAKIKNAGRAYVQVGEDDIYEQVQSYWSGAPYVPDRTEKLSADLPISLVDITGKKVQYEVYKTEKDESSVKEIDVVVEYIRKIADENNVPNAPKIWRDKLKSRIYIDDILPKDHLTDFVVNVGMVDNPYEQAQYPLSIDFTNNGHSLVYGAPGTGKTTFLQTFIMSAVKSYSAKELNIYVMDFGSWSLNMFSELPQVGGVAIDSETEKIEKLINMLSKELDSRKKTFAMLGISTIKAFNQQTEMDFPYIVFVIDNLNGVFVRYPEFSEFFEILLQQGANYGIYLIATMNKEIFKISSAVKNNNIALQMKDKSEYSSVVGNSTVVIQNQSYGTLEPENNPGRGLSKGTPIAHEFQTALPAFGANENEVLSNLKSEIKKLSVDATNFAKAIPVLPEVVTYDEVTTAGIGLGLSSDSIEPISIDYTTSNHCIVISEEYKNKGFNIAKVILKQFVEKADAKLIVFDNGSGTFSRLNDITDKVIDTAQEFDEYISELASELNQRKNDSDLSNAETIVVAIDGYRTMFEAIDEKTAARLSAIVRMGKGLKVYLVVSEVCDKIASLCSIEPTMKNIVGEGIGILVGGTFKTHSAFNSDLDYTTANAVMNESEAYIVRNAKAIKFKAIQDR